MLNLIGFARRVPYLVAVALLVTTGCQLGSSGPATGSKIIAAVEADTNNLDPATTSGSLVDYQVIQNVYVSLVQYKMGPNDKGQIGIVAGEYAPGLAESWQVADGGKMVTFKLRKDMKFSNGDPIDAAAAKFTFERAFGLNGTPAQLLKLSQVKGIDSISTPDNTTIQFTLEQPSVLLLASVVQASMSILNPKVVKAHSTTEDPWSRTWLKTNTAGTETGRYILKSVSRGVEYVMTRNPNFFGEPAKTETIVLRVVPDESTRLTLLKSGGVDIARAVAYSHLADLQKDPNVSVTLNPAMNVTFIGLNAKMKPFDNVKVRQAIAYAIPYDTIVKEAIHGFGQRLTGPLPAGFPTKVETSSSYNTDAVKAKALLAEAGYPNGIKVTLSARADLAESQSVAVWVKSEAAKAGIDVTIDQLQGAPFSQGLTNRTLGFFVYPLWGMTITDPFYQFYWHFTPTCCSYTNYINPEIVDLVTRNLIETDTAKRAEASKQVQELVMRDAAWLPLYQQFDTWETGKNVKGLTLYHQGHLLFWTMFKE